MSRLNKQNTFAAGLIIYLMCSANISAQGIVDWLTNPIGTATNLVVDEVNKQANEAWENCLGDRIQKKLSEKAQYALSC